MNKASIILCFLMGISMSVFAQTGGKQYRNGIQFKKTFKAPVIRIGSLTDSTLLAPKLKNTTHLDTQAIYLITLEVDSSYVADSVDTTSLHSAIDTLQKIGEEIQLIAANRNDVINYEDDNWDIIQQYLEAQELERDTVVMDSISNELITMPDTQVFFVLTDKVDSFLVINESIILEDSITIDSVLIDTFYQIGNEILQEDLESDIEEEDWQIVKQELLRDSTINSDAEALSYKEYIIENPYPVIEDTIVNEIDLVFLPIIVEENTTVDENIKLNNQTDTSTIDSIAIIPTTEVLIPSQDTVLDNKLKILNSRLAEMEQQLAALHIQKELKSELEEIKVEDIDTFSIQATPEMTTLQQRIEELEKIAAEPKSTTQSAEVKALQAKIEQLERQTNEQNKTAQDKEIAKLQEKIVSLERQTVEKNNTELASLKKQLDDYQRKSYNNQERRIANQNRKMEAEIQSLRKELVKNQKETRQTIVAPVPAPDSDNEELQSVKTDIASINQNMDMMKQILLQQQIISSLKEQAPATQAAPVNNDKELMLIKAELVALKHQMQANEKQTTPIETVANENSKEALTLLKQQIAQLQDELQNIKEAKTFSEATPVKEIIPEVKPVKVMDLIKGQEKQIVFFKIGSSTLSASSINRINSIIQLMNQYGQLSVVLEAYTDASGNPAQNLLLSKKRAESVKQSMLQYGISSDRIMLDFRGEDVQSDPAFGRRVEIRLKEK